MRKEETLKALNRSLSGLQEDPQLSQRILASIKGEEPMKKKMTMSLVFVFIMLISITVVAYAVTTVYKTITINQKGEIIEEQEVEKQSEVSATPQPSTDERIAQVQEQEYLSSVPEDQYAEVTLDGSGSSKVPQRTIFSESDFIALMDECDYMTLPEFIPEGYHFEMATIFLGCDKAGEYRVEEIRQEDGRYFARYSIATDCEVVIGYDVTYRNEGQYINIYDRLNECTADDEHLFSFPEEYDFHSIELPEMKYSISIAGNGWNWLNMMRIVDPPIVCRWYPEKYKMDFPNRLPDYFNYQLEKIDISSNSLEIDVLTSMYDNRCISQSER